MNERDYQSEAIAAAWNAFSDKLKWIMLVLATGLGKTFIFARITKLSRIKGNRILILVNRDTLASQTLLELRNHGVQAFLDAGKDHAPILSDVVVGSIQTLSGKRLSKWARNYFQLVIYDECHGSGAETVVRILDYFESAHHIHFTATPNRHDKKGLWHRLQGIVFEMPLKEIRDSGGKLLAKGGIEEGWLVPPQFEQLPVPITLDDYAATKKSLTEAEEEGQFEKDGVIERIFSEGAKMLSGYKSLCFFPGRKASQRAADAWNSMGLPAKHIECYMNKSEKRKIMDWFENSASGILCNCSLLGYGYNHPGIELIGLFRLYKSLTDFLQAIGRGTRPVIDLSTFENAFQRRAAIAASSKSVIRIIDLAIQNENHNLCTPGSLVTASPMELAMIRKQMNGKPCSLDDLDERLRVIKRGYDKSLDRLAECAVNGAAKAGIKAKYDGPYVGHILAKPSVGNPASPAFLNYLQKAFGYTPPKEISAQQGVLIKMAYIKHNANKRQQSKELSLES